MNLAPALVWLRGGGGWITNQLGGAICAWYYCMQLTCLINSWFSGPTHSWRICKLTLRNELSWISLIKTRMEHACISVECVNSWNLWVLLDCCWGSIRHRVPGNFLSPRSTETEQLDVSVKVLNLYSWDTRFEHRLEYLNEVYLNAYRIMQR